MDIVYQLFRRFYCAVLTLEENFIAPGTGCNAESVLDNLQIFLYPVEDSGVVLTAVKLYLYSARDITLIR